MNGEAADSTQNTGLLGERRHGMDTDLTAADGIPIQCQFCVGRAFRRSRLRFADLSQIFLMRYPVRCLRCSQRQMVSFTVAGVSVPSHVHHKQRSSSSERGAHPDAD